MAVAEVEKVEKVEKEDRPEGPERRASPCGRDRRVLGWPPRKFAEARAFLTEVRAELKKVTWPSRQEV